MLALARLYSDEEAGGFKNDEEAMVWYKKAADRGSATGTYFTGLYLYRQHDYQAALDWFIKASNTRYPDQVSVYYHIGECHFKLRNYAEAMEAFKLIHSRARSETELRNLAVERIAEMYEHGLGVEKDRKKAVQWIMEID